MVRNTPRQGRDVSLALALDGRVATLTIDRAAKRNAFDLAMWQALPGLLDDAEAHRELRVLVIRSALAGGAFCAGADIAEMLGHKDDAAFHACTQAAINTALHRLARFPLPTLAFIEGDCMGGGVGLAVACDLRIATLQARFAITPARLGLVYPLHDVANLVSLIGAGQARRMLLTGLPIDASEALRIGLVERIADGADDWIAAIVANSANSTMQLKRFVRRVVDGQSEDDAATLATFAAAFAGADFVEGTSAFVEKRAPSFGPRGD
jgi:enoyl-CoA hydratase/carnithine racemase